MSSVVILIQENASVLFQGFVVSYEAILMLKHLILSLPRVKSENNIRKVAERKTCNLSQSIIIIPVNPKFVCKSLLICLLLHQV